MTCGDDDWSTLYFTFSYHVLPQLFLAPPVAHRNVLGHPCELTASLHLLSTLARQTYLVNQCCQRHVLNQPGEALSLTLVPRFLALSCQGIDENARR